MENHPSVETRINVIYLGWKGRAGVGRGQDEVRLSDINLLIRARPYSKRGVKPKCGVQEGKYGVQSAELWSPY